MRAALALVVALVAVVSAAAAPKAVRKPAPPLAGVTLDGTRVSLARFRGRPVFVNVWSSW